jgi:ribose transport system permease protein
VTPTATETEQPTRRVPSALRPPRMSRLRDSAVLISLIVLFVVLSITADNFLSVDNLKNVLDQATSLGIIATAGTLVIVAGAFDLSVGSIFAMSGVIAAELATHGTSVGLALALGIASGAVLGVANGLFVSWVRINPFIATLATSIMIRGIALAITGGNLITVEKPSFAKLGNDEIATIKLSTWIFLAWALLMGFLLWRTVFGRYLKACGGNEQAARLSGIRVGAVRTAAFAISGLAAALAGILAASEISTGQADVGVGLELNAVAAIVVGGTSIRGGEGAVWRTMVGVLLLALIGNGFNLLSIDSVYQQVVYGGIILLAAGVDARLRRRD